MDYCPLMPMQVEMVSPGPDLIAIVTAFATLLVAAAGAWIAGNQVRAARNALKINLFDRRFAVYQCASRTLLSINSTGIATPDMQAEFLQGTSGARWIFDDDVHALLNTEIFDLMIELNNADGMMISARDRADRSNWRAIALDLKKQALPMHARLNILCGPYLKLSH
ncbi:hypothetical protein [Pseudomonas oryzihabitans]|uniref:Uncharacterized protein n=1 Tax=Pseudomonas oryzihabitans TaxID=47885 RepID=A0A178LJH4_9PSED|nr:hypothetical protein [Pseudomonas oryzihabitans]OAN31141.1 hypothetical protein A4V15_14125 [Pseudomonas oryzihabitans]